MEVAVLGMLCPRQEEKPVAKGLVRYVRRAAHLAAAFALLLIAPASASVNHTVASPAILKETPSPPFSYRLTAVERHLFADASDGRLEEFTLLGAALLAGGVEDMETMGHYESRLAALVDDLRQSGTVQGPPRQQAQVVFDFLHRRLLTAGYRLESTDPREAFDRGRFNCVSATVLFNCLAREFGLPVCALELPGHAMSRIRVPGDPLDIETTCARWFQILGDRKQQAMAIEKVTGPIGGAPWRADSRGPAPLKNTRQAREVTDVELTAMIYYNRGVDLLAGKRFAEAAAANAKSLRLDPANATARGNFLATLNNWAVDLGGAGHYAQAAAILQQGMAIDPNYETFRLNYVHLCRQWVEDLCANGRFSEALNLLVRAAGELPEEPYFPRARAEVRNRWARHGLQD